MVEKYYNIHHLISFKVVFNSGLWGGIFREWDIELRGFESGQESTPDFIVSLDGFTPSNQSCHILDDKYYVKNNYFYCQDSYKYAKWELEMSGWEQGSMTVRIHSNLLGKTLIPELVINPLIWLKLNEKGYPIVHSSGVSQDGKAYIFAGQGASGKTSIALDMVARGFKLLGDHFVILDKGAVLSFPTPFHLTDFNLTPMVKDNMGFRHKTLFQLNQLFCRLTGRRLATKILPRDIFPDSLIDTSKLHCIFLLLPRGDFKAESIGKEELIDHLVMNQKLESFPFIKYLMEYSYLFPQSEMAKYWTRYQENLRAALAPEIAMYKVEVPLKYDNETMERISEYI